MSQGPLSPLARRTMDFSNPFSSSKGLSGSKMLDSLKESVGLKEKEQSLLGDLEDSISLTKMQRLYGFGICLGIGILLSLLSSMFLFPVPR